MQEPTGGEAPKRTDSVRAEVLRPDDGASIYVRVLGDGPILGAYFHYSRKDGGHPCLGQDCHCKNRRTGAHWKGYFAGEQWDEHLQAWFPGAVEITENCGLEMGGCVHRGEVWILTREPKKPGRAGKVTPLLASRPTGAKLRPAFDLRPILWHLHRVEVHLDEELRIPAKPMMELATGDAPPDLVPPEQRAASPEEIRAKLRAAGITPPSITAPPNGRKSTVKYT